MLNLKITFCIVFCIVITSATSAIQQEQSQTNKGSESLPRYEIVDFGIEDAVPIDINNSGEVLINYVKGTKYGIWKNGELARKLPELKTGSRRVQYSYINDNGDVYAYRNIWNFDENTKEGKTEETVVKITRSGKRFDWPRLQDESKPDESLRGLIERQRRIDAYLKSQRNDTIDEYITSKGADPPPESDSIFPKTIFIKEKLGSLPDVEDLWKGEIIKIPNRQWATNTIVGINDQGVILGNHEKCVDHNNISGVMCDTNAFLYHNGNIETFESLLSNEINLRIPQAYQINNAGYVIVDAVRYSLDSFPAKRKYLLRPSSASSGPEYPQYTVYSPPTVPEVVTWGKGVPSRETNDWSWLIPKTVCDERKLNGLWIVMAVYGQHLFDLEGQSPKLTWPEADKHLDYKLLHSGTYSTAKVNGVDDPEWWDFWRGLDKRNDRQQMAGRQAMRIDDADVYVVAVRLAPYAWAGRNSFKLGDLTINWTLPEATNVATTRFVRQLTKGGENLGNDEEYEPIDNIFKYDRFFVEIETRTDVITEDEIPFELFVSHEGRPMSVVGFGQKQDVSTLHAYRIDKNRRLYRSDPLFVQQPQGLNGWRERDGKREAGIALGNGDRLAVRVVPHGVARQGPLGMLRVSSAPANSWSGAVKQAAELMEVKPPRQLEQLSREEFNKLLREPWDTVDSTPFVKFGGRKISLELGDLAAMLLIRQRFNETMEQIRPQLRYLHNWVNNVVGGTAEIREVLRRDALREGSPIGDIAVPDPRFPLATVPFRLVYDDAFLDRTFRSDLEHRRAERRRWLDDATKSAVNEYYNASVQAYRYAKGREIKNSVPDTSLDLKNAKDMLQLTAIGMGRMVDQIKPDLLRLVENPGAARWEAFHWEVDTVARGYVGTIGALGEEFHANEALIDEYNTRTMLAAAGTGFLLPEAAAARAIWAVVNAVPMAMTLKRELPDYLSRREDVQFALGAYQAIGQERYITADLRAKPGWAVALDLVGGSLDVIASVAQLHHARSAWVAMRSDTQVAAAFAEEPYVFIALPRERQKAALIRLAQLSDMRASGKTLSPLEDSVVARGSQMIDEMQAFSDFRPARYLHPKKMKTPGTILSSEGSIAIISPRAADGAGGVESASKLVSDKPLRIPEGKRWHKFDVRSRIGYGKYAQVYEIEVDGVRKALKVYERGQAGIDGIDRALEAEIILFNAGIPQLHIRSQGVAPDGMAFIVQDLMPSPGLYKPVKGKLMEREMTKAFLDLYRKMGRNGVGWEDGHRGNVYFFREMEDGPLKAGVLDQDRVWEFGKGINQKVWGKKAKQFMDLVFAMPGMERCGIQSLAGCDLTPEAFELVRRGYCIWPDGEYAMMKMLEHKGWIEYDRNAGKFESKYLDVRLVKEYFPRLDRPGSLGEAVQFDIPDHLRHLVPDPPSINIPDGNQSFNTLPFPEIMPWVVPMLFAA